MTAAPRESHGDGPARRAGRWHRTPPTITRGSDDDAPVVRWPDPSRLESWWNAIMHHADEPPVGT
ncbi:hypothetical protein ACFRAQ_16455 [Nocardia sp. NPDC056611]|uniref:hypothetical protein n=1 Tax=unclassified Nocardia TaxID=2637762 RepID=UPI00366BE100